MKIPSLFNKRTEQGQSLVELAVGIIVLLILVAGIVDLGRLLFFYMSLRDAAQEGAVVGQLNPRDCDSIKARIDKYMGVTAGDPGYLVDVQVGNQACTLSARDLAKSCSGQDIVVTINAPFSFVMPLMGGRQLDLSTTIRGTVLRPMCQ
jgi:hypothetical protein